MNCPMCGAPLGPNDYECPKCYTKRSEMGPAYNSNGANNYNTGYGSQNNGYANYNTGYGNQNNGYANNNYNTGYGNQNNGLAEKNSGYGYQNQGNAFGNTGNYNGLGTGSALARSGGSGTGSRVAAIVLIVILLLGVGFWFFVRPGMFKKFDMGNFTVELPMDCKEDSTGLGSSLNGIGEAKGYANDDLGFAWARLDLSPDDVKTLKGMGDQFIDLLDGIYKSQSGYTKISSTVDTLEFKYNQGSKNVYCKMKLLFPDDDNMYAVVCVCYSKDESKMAPKFSRIINSINFK